MVFKPNPFPKSIYDNVAYGPHLYGITHRQIVDEIVETSLRQAALWDESGHFEAECLFPLRRAAAAALHRPRAGGRT